MEPQRKPTHYVGIGASAGGLEALQEFFGHIPSDTGAVFIVAQHLSPDYKSMMPELLSRYTKMPIHQVTDGIQLEADRVYLMPPRKNMLIGDGKLLLSEQVPDTHPQMPIDFFLRSLAENQQHKAVGVVLSGTGSDATRGIMAMKEAGGLVMIQNPESAKFDGMPMSAYSTGLADMILPAEEMGESLVKYFQHPSISGENSLVMEVQSDEAALDEIFQLLRDKSTINFSHYKASTVARRIERRLGINQLDGLSAYRRLLMESPRELQILSKELLIGVTRFFRDEQTYEQLRKNLVPELVDRAAQRNLPVRLWVAGCSTGEEAYSLAMLFDEYIRENSLEVKVNIFATDVDPEAIAEASSGIYHEDIQHDVNAERLNQYFVKKGNEYVVSPALREMVIFATHNMLEDPPFSHIDLVSCRNVLIYFQQGAQKKVLASLFFSLRQNGVMWLGPSESLGDMQSHFDVLDERRKFFRKTSNQRISLGVSPPGLQTPGKYAPTATLSFPTVSQRVSRHGSGSVLEAVTNRLIRDNAPDCIVLNAQFDAVHVYGDVDDYIKPLRAGRVSNNIKDIVSDDMAIAVSTALYRCEKNEEDVFYEDVALTRRSGENVLINLSILYVSDTDNPGAPTYYVVQFINEGKVVNDSDHEKESFNATEHSRQRIRDLELELVKKQEHLQVTIEELETTNEELQSANEELMSANEELQSTNEELQSVNEELYTVNSEYQEKISELTELNDDLDSVINATNIGIVFLDSKLAIRKFTPVSTNYVHLRTRDVGRPFHHITHELDYPEFLSDIARVSSEAVTIDRSVFSKNGHALLVRILPYKYNNQGQGGVVVTLTNISRQYFVESALERAQTQLRSHLLEPTLPQLQDLSEQSIRLLVLDDDSVDRQRIVRMLASVSDRDFQIQEVATIDDAMAQVEANVFDVLLIDYRLTDGTAKDFAEKVRTAGVATPIVIMSGYADVDIDRSFLEFDIFDFLNKDEVNSASLKRSLDYVMQQKLRLLEN